jgi:hypothetical protein
MEIAAAFFLAACGFARGRSVGQEVLKASLTQPFST